MESKIRWNSEPIQIGNSVPSGDWATVRVYDNGGKTIDRYAVIFIDQPGSEVNTFECVGMSRDVTSPQGFYQHSICKLGRHLGKRIPFTELPKVHQNRVIRELRHSHEDAMRHEATDALVSHARFTIQGVARIIADALYKQNPRFDREHFLAVVRGEKELNSRPTRQ